MPRRPIRYILKLLREQRQGFGLFRRLARGIKPLQAGVEDAFSYRDGDKQ
jgi:hypothetical protein